MNIGGAFDTAEVYWRESLRIARQHRSTNQMARAMFGLGGIAAHRGDYVLSRDQFREGLALERDEASLPDVAEALAAVARIESILGEPLPSREHRAGSSDSAAARRSLGIGVRASCAGRTGP